MLKDTVTLYRSKHYVWEPEGSTVSWTGGYNGLTRTVRYVQGYKEVTWDRTNDIYRKK